MFFSTKELNMEKMRNKDGKVISYREKVYVDGKAITKTFKRKSDALSWKKNYSLELQRKEALGIEDIKSIDFGSFSKFWLEMKKNQEMAPRTLDSYKHTLEKYLFPCFDKINLEKINQRNAQKVIQLSKKNGLGIARTNFNLRVLKQILNDGIKLNYLIRNPLLGMRPLKAKPKSLNYWLPHQIQAFLSTNRSDPLYPLFVLALNTGMRRGELLGLCWDKVDLKNRRIEISRIRDRYGLKDTTKTGVIRHLPLNDPALHTLKKLSLSRRCNRFVFVYEDGGLINIRHLSNRPFKRAIERANVPRIRFHDLRTTYASNFVMAGGDIYALSKLLGHTSVEMTTKKYAALHPSFMAGVVNTVGLIAEEVLEKNGPDLAQIGYPESQNAAENPLKSIS